MRLCPVWWVAIPLRSAAMPPEPASVFAARPGWTDSIPAHWRSALLRLAAAWFALLLLTWRDWADMADLWWNVSTYNHILFVPAIVGWLIWIRRGELARIDPSGWWPGLVFLGAALLVWLLGSLADVNLISQLGAVAAVQASVLALLGLRAGWALMFPLAYAVFLVPFGDELVPALQTLTARMTIALTLWSGVPAAVDGVFIDTPAGLFEVAEACSGVQFLIAMSALATLIAHTCFTSHRRRAVFLVVALALPVLANGVRAWGTIYLAQYFGIAFAAGFDHIVYGWIFFALVIVVLLAAFWRWFDRDPDHIPVDGAAIARDPRLGFAAIRSTRSLAGTLTLVLLFGAWHVGASRAEAALPEQAITPPLVTGWARTDAKPEIDWRPQASGADRRHTVRYTDAQGRPVDVFLAVYAAQDDRRDAAGYGQGAMPTGTAWRWLSAGPDRPAAVSDILLAQGRTKRLALTSYRTGRLTTGSAAHFKFAVMRDRILFTQRPAILLIVSAEGTDQAELTDRVDRFMAAMGERGAWIDRAAGLR